MGRQVFTAGEILTAASMNDLGDQTVMVFDDATARATAIPTPVEGMVTYLKDTDEVDKFDGSAFVPVGIAPAILQVVSTVKTDIFSQALAAGAISNEVTGLTATITPSATSSKVLVMFEISHGVGNDGITGTGAILQRNSETLVAATGDVASSRVRVTSSGTAARALLNTFSITFLDAPATTSATTYGVKLANTSGATNTVYVNRRDTDNDSSQVPRAISTITLMEVAG